MQVGGIGGAKDCAEGRARSGSQSPILRRGKRDSTMEVGAPPRKKQVTHLTPLDKDPALEMDPMSIDVLLSKNPEKIELSSDQLTDLKGLFNYFDNESISATVTLRKKVSDDGINTSYVISCTNDDDQLSKLRFIVDHLEQWKNNNFESKNDCVRFISNALEFEPKYEVEKELIKHFSNDIPEIIRVYIDTISSLGQTEANNAHKTFFSHVATIFQQPEMINKVLNQMNFSSCSEQTITTMATLFFSDLDEINLKNATLSNNQLKALISESKNAKKILTPPE